ncbi:MAG: hypothetical protein QOJ98_2722 [Acidobacteriota bacterium]|nr:hypothetical protein [Acidobacteriota bacterium]
MRKSAGFALSLCIAFLNGPGAAYGQTLDSGLRRNPWAPASAAEAKPSRSQSPVETSTSAHSRVPKGPMADAIVQFRQPAVSAAGVASMNANAMADRGRTVQARAEELRRDLERLDGALRPASARSAATTAAEQPLIRRTFSRVLYGASVRVRRELLARIEALPYVTSVQEERTFEPFLVKSVPHIRADQAWSQRGTRGKGVTVAVIDTGVDYTHPAFGGTFGAGSKVIGGWDFVNDDADPIDDYGHGTHVAGIIAADGGGLVGVAPDASIVAYKVIDSNGFGTESDIIAAIERTVDPDQDNDPSDHIDIANASLGSFAQEDDPTATAVENANAAGVLFCLSSGNNGDYGELPSPALAPSAITVGAATLDDTVATFSSRGPSYTFGIKPELVAPGVDIVSSANGGTVRASGTSMAAPHVAGVAALVKSLHQDWTPAELKSAIVSSSIPLQDDVMIAGAGRVDALNATTTATLPSPVTLDFGQDDTSKAFWETSRVVTLRNTSSQPQTLTASLTGQRDGVTVRVVPESVTLAAGESKPVTVQLAVTNGSVPAPREGSLSFGGRVTWSGGTVPVVVPWGFVKAAYLIVEAIGSDAGFLHANIITDGRKHGVFFRDRARVFWRLDTVDIVVTDGEPLDPRVRVVAVEQMKVEGSPVATAHLSEAQYTIGTDTTDATGAPIFNANRFCLQNFVLSFPQGRRVSYENTPDPSFAYPLYFGPLSSRIKVYVVENCSESATDDFYAVLHPPFTGLTQNVTATLRPDWLRQDFRFKPDIPRAEGMTIALGSLRFPGPETKYFLDGGQNHLMRGTSSRLHLYYTAMPDDQADLVLRLERWGANAAGADIPLILGVTAYVSNDKVASDSDVYLDLSPMAFEQPSGRELTFGEGPSSALAGFGQGGGFWAFLGDWRGPLGERLLGKTLASHARVFDANGTLVAEGPSGVIEERELPPGRYRFELTAENALYTAWVDLTKSDIALPKFTGLRIVDEHGRQLSVVSRQSTPALLFSVTDEREEGERLLRVPPRESATIAEYRPHGTTEWRPLPALVTARQYQNNTFLFAGVGTVFRADLTAAIAQSSGPIDLRLRTEDEAGNTAELVLESAFRSVDEGPHRRSTRH